MQCVLHNSNYIQQDVSGQTEISVYEAIWIHFSLFL